MNQTDAVKIVTYLNRAGLLHAMEGQGAVWADALEHVPFEDAKTVCRDLARSRVGADRWVTPGDIIDSVKRLRRARVEHKTPPPPPASIDAADVAAQLTWTRTVTRYIADGHDEATAAEMTRIEMGLLAVEGEPRPVAQLVAQVENTLPRIPRRDVA